MSGAGADVPHELDALRESVGWLGRPREDVVERRHLRTYLAALGHPDEDRVDAPASFVACFLDEPPPLPAAAHFGAGWINGGDRFDQQHAVRVGDVLRSRSRLDAVAAKSGQSGHLALLTFVTEFRHPDGELVVTHTGTRIRR